MKWTEFEKLTSEIQRVIASCKTEAQLEAAAHWSLNVREKADLNFEQSIYFDRRFISWHIDEQRSYIRRLETLK